MKKILLTLFVLALSLPYKPAAAVNVIIIESQSYLSHSSDVQWQGVCTGLGYYTSMRPQATLDSTGWFASTDFLIVSSGVIALSNQRIATIQAYLQQGGRVYLQTEYLLSYTTNIAFRQITNALGGNFTWGGESSGTLSPMAASGSLSTTPNTVTPLTYFWYGTYGSGGCNSHVEAFLSYNGRDYGFIFCVPGGSGARMITTSDQDWVIQATSLPLMRNIAANLASPTYACVSSGSGASVNLGPDVSICGTPNVQLNGTTTGATAYLWSTGATTATITVTSAATYWVRVTTPGCTTSDTITVSQSAPFTPIIVADTTSFCTGDSTSICVTSTFASYQWNNAAANSQCQQAKQAGTYYVTVADANNCTAESNRITLTVLTPPAATITSGKNIFCSNDSTDVCTTAGFVTYNWNVGGNAGCVVAKAAGNYYVTVTDANGCSAESNRVAISIYPVPSVSVVVKSDTFTSYGAVTYQWRKNGVNIPGATGTTYIATEPGQYSLLITDTNGCAAISSGINYTSINEAEDTRVFIYPNPAQLECWLSAADELRGSRLKIYDESGRLVYETVIQNQLTQIKMDVARGIYFAHVATEGVSIVKKLIKW